MEPKGKVIQVQKVNSAKTSNPPDYIDNLPLFARLCYHYPQYTLSQAKKLPYRHVVVLLNEAKKLQAVHYSNLLQISVAPHSKNGYKKLINHYESVIKG